MNRRERALCYCPIQDGVSRILSNFPQSCNSGRDRPDHLQLLQRATMSDSAYPRLQSCSPNRMPVRNCPYRDSHTLPRQSDHSCQSQDRRWFPSYFRHICPQNNRHHTSRRFQRHSARQTNRPSAHSCSRWHPSFRSQPDKRSCLRRCCRRSCDRSCYTGS